MGKLEEISRKRFRKTKMQEAILLTIASGGRLGASLLAPRVMYAMLGLPDDLPLRKPQIIRTAASRLTDKGLVRFENNHYSLTSAGEKILKQWELSAYAIPQPRKWDGKWRVIIFDIPEKKRKIRTKLRQILISASFHRLQDSVWVYPYDCEDTIGLIKINLGIGSNLLYIIADQIENDRFLRMDFGLI